MLKISKLFVTVVLTMEITMVRGGGIPYGIERKTMRPMHHRITYSRQEVKNVSLL